MPGDTETLEVSLEVADSEGRTDLELRTRLATVIVEAKKGWLLPGETQLTKYLGRFPPGSEGRIVSLSDSSVAWAAREVPSQVGGIEVSHLPWDEIRADLRAARRQRYAGTLNDSGSTNSPPTLQEQPP